jgi:predicted nucleotidyltransferase component of viral defense system
MKYTNANSFKAKIKNIAKEKQIPAQQIQQHYLIEQLLRLIAKSKYKNSFIVKGGYLIGNLIGIDKRTTMDLDITLKEVKLNENHLESIVKEILSQDNDGEFRFIFDSLTPIRKDNDYGGFAVKINAYFDTLKEVVFIDVSAGDNITPKEIRYSIKSIFSGDEIEISSYNLETVLAEKLEAVLSRGEGSTRPRDRYDLYMLWGMRKEEANAEVLEQAILNTAVQRKSMSEVENWVSQMSNIRESDYQKQLWENYQRSFSYAKEVSFQKSCDIIADIMEGLSLKIIQEESD